MKIYSLIIILFALTQTANAQICKVIKVSDGDTIVANCNGTNQKIRLCGIDAPELKRGRKPEQPFAEAAKEMVERLLANGEVEIRPVEYDRYKRLVAELFIGNTYINSELVKAGLAYEYKKYSKKCPDRLQIVQAEVSAKSNKAGVWDGGNYVYPWDFRKGNR